MFPSCLPSKKKKPGVLRRNLVSVNLPSTISNWPSLSDFKRTIYSCHILKVFTPTRYEPSFAWLV